MREHNVLCVYHVLIIRTAFIAPPHPPPRAMRDTHSGDGERHAKVFAPLKSEAPRRGSDQGQAVTAAHGGPVVRDLRV